MKKDPQDGVKASKHYANWRKRMVILGEQLRRELPGVIEAWPLSLAPMWKAYWKVLEQAMYTLAYEQQEAGVHFDAIFGFSARFASYEFYWQYAAAAELTTKRVQERERGPRPNADSVAKLIESGLEQSRRLPEKRGINPVTALEASDITKAIRELDGGVAYVAPSDWIHMPVDKLGKYIDRIRLLAESPRSRRVPRAAGTRAETEREKAYRERYGEVESDAGKEDCFHLNIIANLQRIAETDPNELPSRAELLRTLKGCAIKGADRDAVLAAYGALR